MEAIKCVVVGDSDAGKISLLSHLTSSAKNIYKPTVFETQAVRVTIGGEPYTMTLGDIYKRCRRLYNVEETSLPEH
jgi:GTPase SAR1 family protein